MSKEFNNIVQTICQKDARYHIDAYVFIMEALSFTQKRFNLKTHVSGPELLQGMKELLLDRFGPMAATVLLHWGIKTTEDVGHIVFNLVDNSVLSKTDDDDIKHFRNCFDIRSEFDRGYNKQLARTINHLKAVE